VANFTLDIQVSAGFIAETPVLEIILDGTVVSAELIAEQTGSGFSTFSYDLSSTGLYPNSLQFRFLDTNTETKRSVTIESIRINDVEVVTKSVNASGVIKRSTTDNLLGYNETVALDLKDTETQNAFDTIPPFQPASASWDPEAGPVSADLLVQTVTGTNGDDALSGIMQNDDIILAMDGNDTVRGEQGDDILAGGTGEDHLIGHTGNDILLGEDGNDRIEGREDNDQLYGNAGNDRVYGGTGNDIVSGNEGDDRLYGQQGDDTIYGGTGNDTIYDYDDNNTVHGGDGNDKIYLGAGDDTAHGDAGNDVINGGDGINTLHGGDGRDKIYGGNDRDTIYGDNGSDIIGAGDGNDDVYGGKGNDKIYGHDGNDNLNGEVGHDQIFGGNGNDTLRGNEGDDILIGSHGNDTIEGGDGRDNLFSYDKNDVPGGLLTTQIVNSDPIALWRLNDSGSGATNYGSGSGINGTYQGGVTLSAPSLYQTGAASADFDGINDYVSIPNSALINTSSVTARTVELVFNADTTAGRQVLYEEGGATNALNIYIDNGSIYFSARDAGEWGPFNISASINAGQTYHAALVLDTAGSGTIRGYLNGTSVGSGITATNLDSHSGAIAIGGVDNDTYFHDGAFSGDGHYFDGRIAEVALYNAVLSQGELQNHARSLSLESDPNTDDGDDILRGGNGDDSLYASGGNDELYGEGDNDTLYGSSAGNLLDGGDGDDIIYADGYVINAVDPIFGISSLAAEIIVDSPAGYWNMNDTGSTADNLGTEGTSIDGTYNGSPTQGAAALYAGGDPSVDFDGVNDILNLPDSAAINTGTYTEKTVELVFNADTTAGRQVLYEEGGTTHGLSIYIDNGTLYVTGEHHGEWADANINAAINAGETYHVAFVFDQPNDSFTGYLNGTVMGSVSVNNAIFPSHGGNVGIGGAPDGLQFHDGESSSGGFYFDGRISDVAIYTSALTQADLQSRADIVQGTGGSGSVPAIDDTLYGGDGEDQLYGGNGRDAFVFEAASAFNNVDQIYEFGFYDHDALDISDLLTGFNGSSDINDFVLTTQVGGNTLISVDTNGATGGANFVDIAQINGITGLTADILNDNGSIIA
jgi:Ca2+-binding RTX toxin-like protein